MSDTRKRSFDTLPNVGVPVEFVTDAQLDRWVIPAQPLHSAWRYLSAVHMKLLPALEMHPARHTRDRTGRLIDGDPSQYPVPWTYLLGDIFHPLSYRYRRQLNGDLPPPSFEDYA